MLAAAFLSLVLSGFATLVHSLGVVLGLAAGLATTALTVLLMYAYSALLVRSTSRSDGTISVAGFIVSDGGSRTYARMKVDRHGIRFEASGRHPELSHDWSHIDRVTVRRRRRDIFKPCEVAIQATEPLRYLCSGNADLIVSACRALSPSTAVELADS